MSLVLFAPAGLRAGDPPDPVPQFLRDHIHVSQSQLSAMERGEALGKVLDTQHPSEVPPFGMIRVKVSPDFFLERYRDIENFKKSKEVLQIGKFHSPPRLEDLNSLTLDGGDIDALRKCKPGDCAVKLSAAMIGRFQREVNWTAPDYASRASTLFRQILFEYLQDYLSKGNAALVTYEDKKMPLKLADEFRSVLQLSPYLREYVPELHQYLADYPDSRPGSSEEFVYWSKEKFGYKPVISLTHVTLYRPPGASPRPAWIAAKQLYASHYFQGSLGLAAFVAKAPAEAGGGYLIYLNRSRVDLPQGLFSGVIRYFVKRRVLDGLEKYLKVAKDKLEADFRKAG